MNIGHPKSVFIDHRNRYWPLKCILVSVVCFFVCICNRLWDIVLSTVTVTVCVCVCVCVCECVCLCVCVYVCMYTSLRECIYCTYGSCVCLCLCLCVCVCVCVDRKSTCLLSSHTCL